MKCIYDTRIHLLSSRTDRFIKRHTCPGIFYTDAQGFTCFELEFTQHDSEKNHIELAEGCFLTIEGGKGTGLIYTPDGSELGSHELASHEYYDSFQSIPLSMEKMNHDLPNPYLELCNTLRCYKIVSLYFKEKRPKNAVCKTVRVPFTDVPYHEVHLHKLISNDYKAVLSASKAG